GDCPACHLRKRGLDDYLQNKVAVMAELDASEPKA
ncbi:MAG: 7-cyano-7-deazaguanine synthase QueC, partial [Shewanella oncorhynchi]